MHLQEASSHTQTALTKVDELQQAMLVLSLKFPQLGTKLAWALFATLEDYTEKRVSRTQHAACLSLLLQLEMIVTGDISSLADLPTCSLLAEMLPAVGHQQQEISYEISVLFLARRKLQVSLDFSRVRGYFSILLVSCFMWSGALEGSNLLLLYSITSLA